MKRTALILLAFVACEPAWAYLPFGRTPAEDVMCKARIAGRDISDVRNWQHMHHYCDGLRFYNRAMASTSNRMEFNSYIVTSIKNFDYVLSHTTSDFEMRPEIIAEKARALALAGRKAEAIMLYTGVVVQTPKYVPAYLYLADHYAGSDRKKALELVSLGLRHNPATKSLQRRYAELGGKLPYPAPIEPVPLETPAAKPVEAAASTSASPAEPAPGQSSSVAPVAEPVAPPKIGSPKNPYCRFCPD